MGTRVLQDDMRKVFLLAFVTPAGSFLGPRGMNLNNLGRGPQSDATY